MIIEKMPPLAIIKHLRGTFDVYVMHIGGVDKVVLRTWPRKGSGYRSEAFKKNVAGATITIEAYRQMTAAMKGTLNSLHRGLNDTFLDHFRTGYQHFAYKHQSQQPFASDFQMRVVGGPFPIQIRFYKPFPCRLYINYREHRRAFYSLKQINRSRGIICTVYYWLRPLETDTQLATGFNAGWTAWYNTKFDREIEVFCEPPTFHYPIKPWFGPYPVKELLAAYQIHHN